MAARPGILVLFVAAFSAAAPAQSPAVRELLARPGAAYEPLTPEQRWELYWRSNFASPGAYFRTLGRSVGSQFADDPPEWGQGMEGYSRRAASNFAFYTVQGTAEAAAAAALGHEVRYVPCGCQGFWKRLGYAASSMVLTHDQHGNRVFASARAGAQYAASMTTLAWFPGRYGWKDGLREGSQRFITGAGFNVLREFGPDVKRALPGRKKR